jgi:phage-related minor tail protein
MDPASLARLTLVQVAAAVTSAVAFAVAVVESLPVRHTVGVLLKITWLYFATGTRG